MRGNESASIADVFNRNFDVRYCSASANPSTQRSPFDFQKKQEGKKKNRNEQKKNFLTRMVKRKHLPNTYQSRADENER